MSNLGEHLGAFAKNPEVQRKAQETLRRKREEKRLRKESIQSGFSESKAADPVNQTLIINKLTDMALGKDIQDAKWAIDMMNKMNLIKHPEEKVIVEEKKEKEMSAEDALAVLKQKGF